MCEQDKAHRVTALCDCVCKTRHTVSRALHALDSTVRVLRMSVEPHSVCRGMPGMLWC